MKYIWIVTLILGGTFMKILIGTTVLHSVEVDSRFVSDKCRIAIKGYALMGGIYELVRQPEDKLLGKVRHPHFLSRWVGHIEHGMKPAEARLLV